MEAPYEIHPIFLYLRPSECILSVSDFPFGEEENEYFDKIPLFYEIVEKDSTSEIIPLEDSLTIRDVLDAVKKHLNDSEYGILFKISAGSKRRESFISDLSTLHEEWLSNEQLPFVKVAVFVCPFSLLFCSSNEKFADSRFIAGKEILGIVPAQNHIRTASTNEYIMKMDSFHKNADCKCIYYFFQPNELKKAARVWCEKIVNALKVQEKLTEHDFIYNRIWEIKKILIQNNFQGA